MQTYVALLQHDILMDFTAQIRQVDSRNVSEIASSDFPPGVYAFLFYDAVNASPIASKLNCSGIYFLKGAKTVTIGELRSKNTDGRYDMDIKQLEIDGHDLAVITNMSHIRSFRKGIDVILK